MSLPENKFGLITSIKKMNVIGQDVIHHYQPTLAVDSGVYHPDVVDQFTYLGSTMRSKGALHAEISMRRAKVAAVIIKLNMTVGITYS